MGLQAINWADRSVVKFISGRPVIVASFKLCDNASTRLYSLEELTGFVLISKLAILPSMYIFTSFSLPCQARCTPVYLAVLPFHVRARCT